jgi:hypothetical protein
VTVFNQDLIHQDSDLLAHGMTQIVRVHHPLQEISLHSALAARLLQFSVKVQDVGLERLALTAL